MLIFQLAAWVFIVIGVLQAIFPRVGWYLKYGWQFKDAEPSKAALVMNRIGGILAVAIGIYLLSQHYFSPF